MEGNSRFSLATVAIIAFAVCWSELALSQRSLAVEPASATEQRVALVIGNASYDGGAQLRNPVNDATDVAKTLRELGFQVTLMADADWRKMRVGIQDFTQALSRGGIGLFFFAGHGIESNGKNYLIPVKSSIEDELDLEGKAIDANSVLQGMERARNRLNIVILDACRNNPYSRGWRSAPQGGLAQMAAPAGSFIAFATSPGRIANDGTGRNGIFTKHLLANLQTGESDIDRVFNRVTHGVAVETRNSQVPWKQSSLTNIFRFRNDEQLPTPGQIDRAERAQWDAIKASTDPRVFDNFIVMYPNGYYVDQAKDYRTRLLNDLKLREEQEARFGAEKFRLDEERRQQQARIEEERRKMKEQELRLQAESRARQEALNRQKVEMQKPGKGVYVPPTF